LQHIGDHPYSALRKNLGDVPGTRRMICDKLRRSSMLFDLFVGAARDSRFIERSQRLHNFLAPKWRHGENRWRHFAL
jgi:hypothetical protein